MKRYHASLGLMMGTLALCCLVSGCGTGNDSPPRYELTGNVTFNGQPVPAGYILLRPDTAQGNDGPGGYAEINGGKYHATTQGPIGGPHVATICAYDGVPFSEGPIANPLGKPLRSQLEISLDLPHSASTYDFELTAQ